MKKYIIFIIIILSLFSCLNKNKGTLKFFANGEDFVRQGFIDKDNWHISFDKLFINLSNITSYSTDGKTVELKGPYYLDLAQGDENAELILIDTKQKVQPANYQGLKFSITKAKTGKYPDYSIVMIGKAKKNKKTIDFIIKINEEIDWDCKEGYVGDVIKGIVEKDCIGDVETTFHFDHIFGDIEAESDDHINIGSVGFDYFAQFAKDGILEIDQKTLSEKTDKKKYEKFIKSIWGLGHCGEGHSITVNTSTKF